MSVSKTRERARLLSCLAYCLGNDVYRKLFYRNKRYRPSFQGGYKVHSAEEGNEKLTQLIQSGKPFAATRYGGTETDTFLEGKMFELGLRSEIRQSIVDTMQIQSGFFPNDVSLIPRYVKLIEETSPEIDFLASFGSRMENYMVRRYLGSGTALFVSDNRALEPYYFQHKHPWSKALEGKRVLVIHPFADSIQKQYEHRELLFDDKDILPEFELHALKAVQTIVGTKDDRFETWFDALDFMYQEAMKIPFDIAILGCGAYGQPLACMLKKGGKQAIHIGGATQILFGIIGKRWEISKTEISAMFNEHWIRPSAEETPANKEKNEMGGCYW